MKNALISIIVAVIVIAGIFMYARSRAISNAPKTENISVVTTPGVAEFTLAEIRERSTAARCWTTIDGKVYDVTDRLINHPDALILCGKEGSDIVNPIILPANERQQFFIGNLAK